MNNLQKTFSEVDKLDDTELDLGIEQAFQTVSDNLSSVIDNMEFSLESISAAENQVSLESIDPNVKAQILQALPDYREISLELRRTDNLLYRNLDVFLDTGFLSLDKGFDIFKDNETLLRKTASSFTKVKKSVEETVKKFPNAELKASTTGIDAFYQTQANQTLEVDLPDMYGKIDDAVDFISKGIQSGVAKQSKVLDDALKKASSKEDSLSESIIDDLPKIPNILGKYDNDADLFIKRVVIRSNQDRKINSSSGWRIFDTKSTGAIKGLVGMGSITLTSKECSELVGIFERITATGIDLSKGLAKEFKNEVKRIKAMKSTLSSKVDKISTADMEILKKLFNHAIELLKAFIEIAKLLVLQIRDVQKGIVYMLRRVNRNNLVFFESKWLDGFLNNT